LGYIKIKLKGWRRFWPPARKKAKLLEEIINNKLKDIKINWDRYYHGI
jgi:hypothetical protein